MEWSELAPFLDSGVAMLGASANADRTPEAFRVWGATVGDGHRLRTLVSSDASRTFGSIEAGSRLAFVFTDITTFESVQVKGRAVGPPQPAGPVDMTCFRRYDERFLRSLEQIGHPPRLRDRLRPLSVFVLETVVDAVFDQTPGPRAGLQVEA